MLAEVNAVSPYGKGLDRAQAFVGTISVGMKINGEQGFVFSLEPMVPEPWRLVGWSCEPEHLGIGLQLGIKR